MGDIHRYYMGRIRAVLIYCTKARVAHDIEHMVLDRVKSKWMTQVNQINCIVK